MRFLDNFVQPAARTGRLAYLLCIVLGGLAGAALIVLLSFAGLPGAELRASAYVISIFAVIVPTVRRVHDIGVAGYPAILLLIPGVAWLAMLVFLVFPPEKIPNRWGPPPGRRTFAP